MLPVIYELQFISSGVPLLDCIVKYVTLSRFHANMKYLPISDTMWQWLVGMFYFRLPMLESNHLPSIQSIQLFGLCLKPARTCRELCRAYTFFLLNGWLMRTEWSNMTWDSTEGPRLPGEAMVHSWNPLTHFNTHVGNIFIRSASRIR